MTETKKKDESKAKEKTSAKKPQITKDIPLGELVTRYPEAAEVMLKHGLHCIGCHMATWETVEQGCKSHGMNKEDIKKMLKEMNDVIAKG